jgi:hypothetical protein
MILELVTPEELMSRSPKEQQRHNWMHFLENRLKENYRE